MPSVARAGFGAASGVEGPGARRLRARPGRTAPPPTRSSHPSGFEVNGEEATLGSWAGWRGGWGGSA